MLDKNLDNTDTELNTNEIVKGDIEYYIDLFCQEYDIEKKSIRPQEWTALLSYIYNNYIHPSNVLRIQLDKIPYTRYNYFMVDKLLDKYINLCNIYNQSITILGFSKLSNISTETIYRWRDDKQRNTIFINPNGSLCNNMDLINSSSDNRLSQVTISPSDIYKKLVSNIEQNINDMVIDSKRRGVGAIVRYNRFYETHSTTEKDTDTKLIDSSELAKQLGIDSQLLAIQDKKQGDR